MSIATIVLIGFVSGLVGAMLVDARFWLGFLDDLRRHGLDNHFCHKAGCCR